MRISDWSSDVCSSDLSRALVDRLVQRTDRSDAVSPSRSGEIELDEAIDALDADRRAAVVLTQSLGLSYAEAAEVCEVPVGTIRPPVPPPPGRPAARPADAHHPPPPPPPPPPAPT